MKIYLLLKFQFTFNTLHWVGGKSEWWQKQGVFRISGMIMYSERISDVTLQYTF